MISLLHISQKENPTFLEAGLSLSLCILSKIIKQASKLETHLTNLTRELKQTLIEVLLKILQKGIKEERRYCVF